MNDPLTLLNYGQMSFIKIKRTDKSGLTSYKGTMEIGGVMFPWSLGELCLSPAQTTL